MQKHLHPIDYPDPQLLTEVMWRCLQGAIPELCPWLVHSADPVFFWSGWSLLRSTQSNHYYSRFQNATDETGTQFSFDNIFFSDNGDTLLFLVVIKMRFFSVFIKAAII